MATYVVGDVQGCFEELMALVRIIEFDASVDRMVLLGDLVNRGPDSLSVLRWAHCSQAAVSVVLGNHDLHLLAVHAGAAKLKSKDTFGDILKAPDGDPLLAWLRQQPLVRQEHGCLLVHAGLLPLWSTTEAMMLADEVQQALGASNYREFFANLYGDTPSYWHNGLQGWDRLRMIVNCMTRMRLVNHDGAPDFRFKGELSSAPIGLLPWFDAAGTREGGRDWEQRVIFGHWSALGLLLRDDVVGLDTGCVWGKQLTALRLEDDRLFQVPSYQQAHLEQD